MIPAPVTLATAPEIETPQLVAAVSSNSVSRVEPELPAIKHIVAEADTFWSIAQRYGVSPEAIAALNNTTVESTLVVGQSLKVPAPLNGSSRQPEIRPTVIAPTSQPSSPRPSVEVAALNLPSQALVDAEPIPAAPEAVPSALRAEQDKLVESIQSLRSQPTEAVVFDTAVDAPKPETLISSTVLTPEESTEASQDTVVISVPQPREYIAPSADASPDPETLIANNAVSTTARLPEPPRPQTLTPTEVVVETKSGDKVEPSRSVTLTVPVAPNSASTPLVRPAEKVEVSTRQPEVLVATSSGSVPQVHVVRAGESLYAIARRYGLQGRELIAANRLANPDIILVGQRLNIPARAQQQPQAQQQEFVALIPPTEVNQGVNRNSATLANAASLSQSRVQPGVSAVLAPAEAKSVDSNVERNTEAAVARLQADITRLRQDYQQQPNSVSLRVPAPNNSGTTANNRPSSPVSVVNPEWQEQTAESTSTATRETTVQEEPQQIAAAPSGNVANYNAMLRLSVGETVTPELPPLASPDNYLPGADVFAGYIWPAQGTLTSGYGPRWGRMHRGIDIAAPTGTPIFAAASGEVITAGWNSGGYGNLVRIRHADGSVTLYAHNSRLLVRQGQQVKQGQHIAAMGSTGFSTGPHLHFEIHPSGNGATNPMAFLPKR
ncbi:peptidoglycan DD-metalloendopeptidase family protein [Picosynechococcus sp. NKBG15041c]|uniref:peptidoglycan DD-metalloendopeptidase family protein n=1 Tax=Picosynechococcus sp. NKBG15041c TaxID=1407650 RepID=UPI00056DD380|nr:peptidoglycan DD-metalloendopeptidase family protein [Picosynechococcus sp. NKBG15041c]